MGWRAGIIFELLAKPRNVHVHSAWSDESLPGPDVLKEGLARESLSRVVDEKPQQIPLFCGATYEGLHHNKLVLHGQAHDAFVYAMVNPARGAS